MEDLNLKHIEDVLKNANVLDVKILMTTRINDVSCVKYVPVEWYGIYIIYLKSKEAYMGMSSEGIGIKNRLNSHVHEAWHKNIIEYIDIFVTEKSHATKLEKILIKNFNPELNTVLYKRCKVLKLKKSIGKVRVRKLRCGKMGKVKM